MDRFLLLHGWGGSDYPHWQSWLAGELAKEYGTVSFPLIHHPHHPNKKKWMNQFKKHLKTFRPTTVICHSLACTVWMALCEEGEIDEVERLLFVAPPSQNTPLELLKQFFPHTFPQTLFAKEVQIVVSTNDPYLKLEEAHDLQRHFDCEMLILENAGHINDKSGYGQWPWVLAWAKRDPSLLSEPL
ncbi:hypothetical protein NitYY0826_C1886 [Nitratiruptor sp. YY08-26]|uniref:RBBP9/YdeN family alpha/beta hydrolase n=1 Tax=unclassified Nitratiruptor TaxID=2624044 RepID=UPI0019164607|nr:MULTISPECIES: alpha/beta hydrolase [unclassified Nitratiruptor]BCD62998.1 hypothetical protein NitYY0813_C1884 [Nitratiruptor sp. YY08-13]BCD66933.1 hypothetical protein NitYY0826_C1886 [Nitratiruptor sp. YY08-26]